MDVNVSFFEIFATVCAAVGTGLSFFAKRDADRSCTAAYRFKFNGDRRLIAERIVRTENAIFTGQLILLIVGAWAMNLAPPPFPRFEGVVLSTAERDLLREIAFSIIIIRIGMAALSFVLMRLSYKNWVQLAPIRARRDDQEDVVDKPAVEVLASTAAHVANGAVNVAKQAQAIAEEKK
jgi:hypothetical protein